MAEWFLMSGSRAVGPLTEKEVKVGLASGEYSPVQFAWELGSPDWKRVMEFSCFKESLPEKPTEIQLEELKKSLSSKQKSPPPLPLKREWYLYLNGIQEGPYELIEVKHLVEGGGLTESTYVWKEGFLDWKTLGETELLSFISSEVLPERQSEDFSEEKEDERRSHPRKPVIARVLFHDNRLLGQGICRDLSVGGAQVLIDTDTPNLENLKFEVNSVLHMNIHRDEENEAFTVAARIVRMLKGRRGFAVRFEKLSDEAGKTIEGWVGEKS